MTEFARDSRIIEISRGQRIGLAVFGAENGVPVLALHGTPASRLMFNVADEAACKLGLTLYCPERPGYGLSQRAMESRSGDALSARTDELVEVVEALDLKRFSVIGVSGGAPYAVSLASRLGSRVVSLGLVSPMGPVADLSSGVASKISARHQFLFFKLARWPMIARVLSGAGVFVFSLAPKFCAKVFARGLGAADHKVLSKAFARSSLITMTGEALRGGALGALYDLRVFSRPWGVDFSAITCPIILWIGTADRLVPLNCALWLGERLPGCRVRKLEGAGHFWVYENIEEVLDSVVQLTD